MKKAKKRTTKTAPVLTVPPGKVIDFDPAKQNLLVRDMTVPERLREVAKIYEERNLIYGSDYQDHGRLMMALFPLKRGITLSSDADFIRYNLFKQMAAKLARYAKNFFKGGHVDSLDDLAVYAQMLREMDDKINNGGGDGNPTASD